MGLHLCYDLRLPGHTPDATVIAVLERLLARALATEATVTGMLRHTLGDLQTKREFSWHISAEDHFHLTANYARRERDGSATYGDEHLDCLAAVGFSVHPGRGSEGASFGFVRPLLESAAPDAEAPEDVQNWIWHTCCKTQYASVVSNDHLVRCHLLLVDLLEEAARLGVDVTVRDETGYWETRSTARLISEVDKMNRIVARFAGALDDAMPDDLKTQAPIFTHREFERLETYPPEAD